MKPAEFRCLYEYLGLTPSWLAQFLNVEEDTVVRWEDGLEPIPESAAVDLIGVARTTSELAQKLATDLRWGGTVITYRSDAEFRAADPYGLNYPASWHRAVAARVADRAFDVTIDYND
jgi:DNA-binding XRE family transcriptional regulator